MFAFQDRRGAVEVAFTDRHGGVSSGAFGSLNLGRSGDAPGDPAGDVAENQRRVAEEFTGMSPAPGVHRMRQVHGADVEVVAGEPAAEAPVADALVAAGSGTVLMVRVADCLPLILADPDRGVVGAAHAGRGGLVAGVVPAALRRMRDQGASRIVAWVGPHVCGSCYEVPAAMRDDVAAAVPEARATTRWGTPAVDVGAGVRAQLASAGVEVVDAGGCTIEDENLFSYRRQGPESGRMAGLVWIRP